MAEPRQDNDAINNEELLGAERPLLDAMLAAAKDREQATQIIEIVRKGEPLFAFKVRVVTEEENEACLDKATRYKKDRRAVAPIPIGEDTHKYRSLLIVQATVCFLERNEDGSFREVQSMWDSADLLRQFNIAGSEELVDKILLPGEKERIIDKINDLSGFGDLDAKDQAKN